MRAVVYDRFGPPDVLRLAEVERPVAGPGEVLVKVHATTVNRADCATRDANQKSGRAVSLMSRLAFGIRGPRRRILGREFAGVVAEVGAGVSELKAGDHVFGLNGLGFGAHAEYIAIRSNRVAPMPTGMSFEDAAALTDGPFNALGCLRSAGVRKGQRILVYGASGSIGTAGVQLARYFGAHITAVCRTKDFDLVRSLGADEVIDYTQEDFTRNGQTYDMIFDAAGKLSFRRCRQSLVHGGRFLPTDGPEHLFWALWALVVRDKRVIFPMSPQDPRKELLFLKDLVEAGQYRSVIDRVYPLEEVVAAATYVETGEKVGNVVLTL